MQNEKLESRLQSLEPMELFRISLGRAAEYDLEFLDKVRQELEKRGITLDSVIDQFEVHFNNDLVEIENHEQAGEIIDEKMSIWDAWTITNYLQEQLTIQKGSDFWVIQYDDAEDNGTAFGMDDAESVKTMLRRFASLDDWEPDEEDWFTFEDWETILSTTSRYYIEGWSAKLEEAEIPFLLRPVRMVSADPLFVSSPVQERQALLIQGEHLDEYNELVSALEQRKSELLARLDDLEDADDLEGQLAVYNQLDDLAIVDSYIFYNKACVLFDSGRFDEAAVAVILSIGLDLDLGQLSKAQESIDLLVEILAEAPENIDVLSCLADLEAQRNNLEIARSYYQRIIRIDEDNAVAHLNLGYLYFENSEMHSLALKHFNRFLEVADSEEEKKVVQDLLSQSE